MRNAYLIAAAFAGALVIIHWSPWIYWIDGGRPLPDQLGVFGENGSHYLGLERELWTCLLTALVLALIGEGICRGRRAAAAAAAAATVEI